MKILWQNNDSNIWDNFFTFFKENGKINLGFYLLTSSSINDKIYEDFIEKDPQKIKNFLNTFQIFVKSADENSSSTQASGITTLHKAGTIAQANRQGRSGCMGSGMRSMETRSQSGAHPKGKERKFQ